MPTSVDFYAGVPPFSSEQIVVFRRGPVVKKQRCDDDHKTCEIKKGIFARNRTTTFVAGNNVGTGLGKQFFASMAYAAWRARRTLAFAAISMAYPSEPEKKVPIRHKGAFANLVSLALLITPRKTATAAPQSVGPIVDQIFWG